VTDDRDDAANDGTVRQRARGASDYEGVFWISLAGGGMDVTFLGTGSAMPTAARCQTGIVVETEERSLLVDCGSGVLHRLESVGPGYESVSTVLLTHHHLDHVADLLPLLKARWLAGEEHLEVVGPTGTKALLDGLLDVHEYLDGRVDLQLREVTPEQSFSVAGFDVTARDTRHSLPCLAYRFDDRFGYSGDTEAFTGLANFFDGCAVVAHDCSFPDSVDVSNHPTPTALGEAFADANADVGRLYLTHRYPHTDGHEDELCDTISELSGLDARIATDGLTITIS
jgi:ribonuclease BN (tRNA processing enzyme)